MKDTEERRDIRAASDHITHSFRLWQLLFARIGTSSEWQHLAQAAESYNNYLRMKIQPDDAPHFWSAAFLQHLYCEQSLGFLHFIFFLCLSAAATQKVTNGFWLYFLQRSEMVQGAIGEILGKIRISIYIQECFIGLFIIGSWKHFTR